MAEEAVANEVYANQVKLFGKWNPDEVNVEDISLGVSDNFCSTKTTIFFNLNSTRTIFQLKEKLLSTSHTQLVATK